MIRPIARSIEIQGVVNLMTEAFARSRWIGIPGAAIDREEAISRLSNAYHRMNRMKEGGTFFYLAENDGKLTGFMVGEIDRIYGVGTLLQASDVYLCAAAIGADPNDWMRLVKQYLLWARQVPGMAQVLLTQIDFVEGEDSETIRRYYDHLGFKKRGTIYEAGK